MMGTVLLADDNEDDIFFVRYAFEAAGLEGTLIVVRDGEEVIDYLLGRRNYANREVFPEPDLLLLDVKMPKMNGFEVLGWLKTQPLGRELPTIVLSSSSQESDRRRAKSLGAAEYRVKVCGVQQTARMLMEIWEHWLYRPGVSSGRASRCPADWSGGLSTAKAF